MENNIDNLGGRKPTSGLFKQFGDEDAPYDLDVFKETFFIYKELSGYLCSQEVLTEVKPIERWDEWKRIFSGNERLGRLLKEWQEELEFQLRAEAAATIAKGCDPKDFPRLKYIRDGKLFDKTGAGRPSKRQPTKKDRIKTSAENKVSKNQIDKVIALGGNR